MYAEHRRPLVAFAAVTCACALAIGNAAGVTLTVADPGESRTVEASRSPRAGDVSLAQAAIHASTAITRVVPATPTIYSPVWPADVSGGNPTVVNASHGGDAQTGQPVAPPTPSFSAPSATPSGDIPLPSPSTTPSPSDAPSEDIPESTESPVLTFDDLIEPSDPGELPPDPGELPSEPDPSTERVTSDQTTVPEVDPGAGMDPGAVNAVVGGASDLSSVSLESANPAE